MIMKKYQIVSYQLVYASGSRDTVRLRAFIEVTDLEKYRAELKKRYNCAGVNLTFIEP
jgi:hypothetical protein